jgi:mono/diheme cytochrome c family protein
MARTLLVTVVLSVSLLIASAGCGDKKDVSPSPSVPAEHATARKTFDMKCSFCHTINAAPGEMKKKGPDLGKVAALPEHNREWILSYIRDPKSKKPDSKMPKFGEKLSAEEIGALADYLATLK